jgi:hypothetical protein
MHAITSAARIVKSAHRSHPFEVADLVSIGAERVIRYLSGSEGAAGALVFVCAKQGMLYELRRWQGRDPHGLQGEKRRKSADPVLTGYHEWMGLVPTPPYETLIDLKRALLAMQLREAVSWYSHHWLCEELDHLENELGVSEGRIRQYCAAAKEKLQAAWRGERFETADEASARKDAETQETVRRRSAANERMLTERKTRYAELRAMGADSKQAAWGGAAKSRYRIIANRLSRPIPGIDTDPSNVA